MSPSTHSKSIGYPPPFKGLYRLEEAPTPEARRFVSSPPGLVFARNSIQPPSPRLGSHASRNRGFVATVELAKFGFVGSMKCSLSKSYHERTNFESVEGHC
jgi:hypothetical protein